VGRKPIPDAERCKPLTSIRVTDADAALIREAAEADGERLATWIARAAVRSARRKLRSRAARKRDRE